MNILKRTIVTLTISGMLLPGMVFAAYDASQVLNQASSILVASGFEGGDPKVCIAGNILGQLDDIIGNFRDIIMAELGSLVSAALDTITQTLTQCAIGQALDTLGGMASGIPGIGPVIGGLFGAAGGSFPDCVVQVAGGDMAAYIRQREMDWRQNFIGRCVAAQSLHNMLSYTDQLLAEQGPNGGPAAVSNWVNDLYTEPDRQAVRRMWAILVNTPICPYFRDDVLDYFTVPQSYRDNPPNISAVSLNTSANMPFQMRGACTLPSDVELTSLNDPASLAAAGGFDFLDQLNQPQNNIAGFINMAEAEMQRQRAVTVEAAINEAVAGGGYRSIYGPAGEGCLIDDPDGRCIEFAGIRQAARTAADLRNDQFQALYAWAASTDGTDNPGIMDIEAQFANRLMDMANQPLPFRIQFGLETNADNFTPVPTATPEPGDPSCTGGDPACTCVQNNQTIQGALTPVIRVAIANTRTARPELFDPPGSNHIAAGVDYRTVLDAICSQMQQEDVQVCSPHPILNNRIVLNSPSLNISIDVITDTGDLRTNGGRVMAVCEPGV